MHATRQTEGELALIGDGFPEAMQKPGFFI
jgi:hypothetical protein